METALFLFQAKNNFGFMNMSLEHHQNEINNESLWCNTYNAYGPNTFKDVFELAISVNNRAQLTKQSQENRQGAFETTIEALAVNFCLLGKEAEKKPSTRP